MAKRSRRARRQAAQKQKTTPPPDRTTDSPAEEPPAEIAAVEIRPVSRKVVDFAHEYYYVYADLKHILIVAILMFVVLAGLSFVI